MDLLELEFKIDELVMISLNLISFSIELYYFYISAGSLMLLNIHFMLMSLYK